MTKSKRQLGPFQQQVLLLVNNLNERAYGAAIQRELNEITGKSHSLGQVYAALERLEARGLVESKLSSPLPKRGGRSKRVFKMKDEGKRQLEEIQTTFRTFAFSGK